MPVYHLDPNTHRVTYGTTIGILVLNVRLPFVPGDAGNASTFGFPVLYRVVEELVTDKADPALTRFVVREARALERAGVAAITASCGNMALYQKEVAAAVNVPVFLSSWMQVPFIHSMLPPDKKVGAVVPDSHDVPKEILTSAGIDDSIPLVIAGLENLSAFYAAIVNLEGARDTDAEEREVVAVARNLVQADPDIGAILLECSCLPPYAAAVQEAVRLPVFDFVTMINYVWSALVRSRYQGTVY
jgi:Asp/Glu/hydantoin racemase